MKKSKLSSLLQLDIDFDKYNPRYTKSLKNYYNTQYTVEMSIGSKKQPFRFIIDTGSGTTLINDQRCTSKGCEERHAFQT